MLLARSSGNISGHAIDSQGHHFTRKCAHRGSDTRPTAAGNAAPRSGESRSTLPLCGRACAGLPQEGNAETQ